MAEPHLSSAEPRVGGFGVPFCLRVSADSWPHGVRVFVAASYRVLNVRGQDPSISGHRTSEFEVQTQKEIVLPKGNLRLNGLLMALSGRANRADECPSWGQ
jgi:hypothetical protein